MARRRAKGTPAAQWFAGKSFNGRRNERPTLKVETLEIPPQAIGPHPSDGQGVDPLLPPVSEPEHDPWGEEPTKPGVRS